jgi:hypothetical protein
MSSIKLKHSGGNSVSLNPPTSAPTSSDVAFKLPNADGSAGQFMKTDGSGNLSFATLSVPSLKVRQFKYKTEGITTNSNSGGWTNSVESGHNVDITPTASDSIMLIQVSSVGGNTNSGRSYFLRLRRKINNANDDDRGGMQIGDGNNGGMQSIGFTIVDPAPTGGWNTSHVVNYRVRFGHDGDGTARYDYSSTSNLTVIELAP